MSAKDIAKMREYWASKGRGIPSVECILSLLDEVEKLKRYAGETT